MLLETPCLSQFVRIVSAWQARKSQRNSSRRLRHARRSGVFVSQPPVTHPASPTRDRLGATGGKAYGYWPRPEVSAAAARMRRSTRPPKPASPARRLVRCHGRVWSHCAGADGPAWLPVHARRRPPAARHSARPLSARRHRGRPDSAHPGWGRFHLPRRPPWAGRPFASLSWSRAAIARSTR